MYQTIVNYSKHQHNKRPSDFFLHPVQERNLFQLLVIFFILLFIPLLGNAAIADAGIISTDDRHRLLGEMFSSLPNWVSNWMAFQHYVFAGSVLFVIWHKEARLYLACIIISHLVAQAEIIWLPFQYMSLELIALNHIIWTPALIYMVAKWKSTKHNSPYGLWYNIAIFQLIFSLVFDYRDAFRYIF